ncbi:MAG: copper amine oxidase N-terminal domain-containing protein [Eubacteriales bacterium]
MKKPKIRLLLLCLALCFVVTYAASAATVPLAKELLISKLRSTDYAQNRALYETSSGTASYEIKALKGLAVSLSEPLATLQGAKLLFDIKNDTPEKKIQADYYLTYNAENYKGNIFIDGSKIIFSTEIFQLIKKFNPEFSVGGAKELPQYLYISDEMFAKMWDTVIKNQGQSVPPELKELLVFAIEAVPDKYFTTALAGQKVRFSLDQQGSMDVMYSILEKVKNEKERFATLAADVMVTYDPTKSKEDLKEEILKSIEESINNGTFPERPAEAAQLPGSNEKFNIEEITCELPLSTQGQGKFTMAVNLGNSPDPTGRLEVEATFNTGLDKSGGTYTASLNMLDVNKKLKVDGQISGEYTIAKESANSKVTFTVNAGDTDGTATLLDLVLLANSDQKVDQDVQINVPVLTESNSMDISLIVQGPPELKVVVDGKKVNFDVKPFIQDGRTMVPLRNLAETLGFDVKWIEPDQIYISRGDAVINMFVGRQTYLVNGVEKQLDVPPFIKDGKRTVVPVRFVAQELGCQVTYDAKTRTVHVNSN